MIVYKIDKQSQVKASTDIRSMAEVVAEITPTLRILKDAVTEQGSGISSPSINNFREELQQRINAAIGLTTVIADDSQKLVAVSDQAAKHVLAIEEQLGTVLQSKATETPVQ